MEPKAALLRVLFLKTLPEAVIAAMVSAGEERRLHKGELLFAEHDRCLGLLVVLSGAVKVYKLDSRGRELTLDRELPGESIAELPLFDGGNYPASAEAAEENTAVFLIRRERFRQLMGEHPEIAERGLLALGIRMRKLIATLEAQALYSVRARLATYLLQMADGRETFSLNETNEAIGSHIGTVREVVSRTLHNFKDAGAIRLNGRNVAILDREMLRRIADNTTDI